jgi:hypothetical protein
MKKLRFEPPRIASAHVALRTAAEEDGVDVGSLRRLLWLMNAHPRLVAHLRVFENLRSLLASPVFVAARDWAGTWTTDIPAWIDICCWIAGKGDVLAGMPGLELFRRAPEHERHHPHFNLGISRHGIVGALWNCHEASSEPAPTEDDRRMGSAYHDLQAHALAAYIDSRFRLSSLDFYEGYDGLHERPIAPIPSATVSPVIREFSLSKYAPALLRLPRTNSTMEFATRCMDIGAAFTELEAAEARYAKRALDTLKRYLRVFRKIHGGWRPTRGTRWGRHYGGGRARRPGFIQYAPGVFERRSESLDDDGGLQLGSEISFDQDADDELLERAGISPAESMEPCLELVDAKELQRRFLAYQWQLRAITGQAQRHRFAYHRLTSPDLRDFWTATGRQIDSFFRNAIAPGDAVARVEAALALRLSLAFGQTLDTVIGLRVRWLPHGGLLSQEVTDAGTDPALLIGAPSAGSLDGAQLVGLLLPGIGPDYRVDLSPELEDIDREFTGVFVLNDYLGVGEDLLQVLRRVPRPDGRLWQSTATRLKRQAQAIIGELDDRITPGRIARTLQDWVFDATGDHTLAWIVTADQSRRNEPRMYYTRHTVARIDEVHHRVSRRLAKIVGVRTPERMDALPNHDATVGARFVLDFWACRQLVEQLTTSLSDRNLDRDDSKTFVEYHNRYVLYLILLQGLTTATRVLARPDELIVAWRKAGSPVKEPLLVSISDKDTLANSKARLGVVTRALAMQFANFEAHAAHLESIWWMRPQVDLAKREFGPIFLITGDLRVAPVTVTWLTGALHEWTGYQVPSNFHRAFLRSELLLRGTSPEIIDAFLGHANVGESPADPLSTFDYTLYLERLGDAVEGIAEELGLRAVESRLIPFSARSR